MGRLSEWSMFGSDVSNLKEIVLVMNRIGTNTFLQVQDSLRDNWVYELIYVRHSKDDYQ